MARGILATCYALPTDADARRRTLRRRAARAPTRTSRSSRVVDHPPDTAHLRGSQSRAGRGVARRAHRPRDRLRRHRQPGQGRRRPGGAVPQRHARLGRDRRPRRRRHLPVGASRDVTIAWRVASRSSPSCSAPTSCRRWRRSSASASSRTTSRAARSRTSSAAASTSIAAAAAAQIADENVALLAPGDEETRTYRNLQRRLGELRRRRPARRASTSSPGRHLARRHARGRAHRRALLRARRLAVGAAPRVRRHAGLVGAVRGPRRQLYKSGFAPLARRPRRDRVRRRRRRRGVALRAARRLSPHAVRRRRRRRARHRRALDLSWRACWRGPSAGSRAPPSASAAAISTSRCAATTDDEIGLVADTMEQMREQLRARDERMQMMLAGIAHEVRNPLGGMELYAGLLRDDLAGDAEKLGARAAHRARARRTSRSSSATSSSTRAAPSPSVAPATSPSCCPRCATSPSPPRSRATCACRSQLAADAGARRRRRGPAAPRARQPRAQRRAGVRRRRLGRGHARLRARRRRGAGHRARHRRRHRSRHRWRRSGRRSTPPSRAAPASASPSCATSRATTARDLQSTARPAAAPPSPSRFRRHELAMATILIIDDNETIREGLAHVVQEDGPPAARRRERQGRARALQADAAPTSSSPT